MSVFVVLFSLAAVVARASAAACTAGVDIDVIASLVSAAESVRDEPGIEPIIAALSTTDEMDPGVTIYAPSDGAFEALEGQVIPNDQFAKIIRNHVTTEFGAEPFDFLIEGFEGQTADNIITLKRTTLLGTTLDITADGGLFVTPEGTTNTAKIIQDDVFICSGVVHVVDRILSPDMSDGGGGGGGGTYGDME